MGNSKNTKSMIQTTLKTPKYTKSTPSSKSPNRAKDNSETNLNNEITDKRKIMSGKKSKKVNVARRKQRRNPKSRAKNKTKPSVRKRKVRKDTNILIPTSMESQSLSKRNNTSIHSTPTSNRISLKGEPGKQAELPQIANPLPKKKMSQDISAKNKNKQDAPGEGNKKQLQRSKNIKSDIKPAERKLELSTEQISLKDSENSVSSKLNRKEEDVKLQINITNLQSSSSNLKKNVQKTGIKQAKSGLAVKRSDKIRKINE